MKQSEKDAFRQVRALPKQFEFCQLCKVKLHAERSKQVGACRHCFAFRSKQLARIQGR